MGAGGFYGMRRFAVATPQVCTRAEVETAVGFCRFPPAGTRSAFWPNRPMHRMGFDGFIKNINDEVVVAVQVRMHVRACVPACVSSVCMPRHVRVCACD